MFKTREDNVRRTDEIISRVIALWPLWAMLAGGIVTAINFYNTVKGIADDQKAWKATLDARREANRQEMEKIRERLIVVETRMGYEHHSGD